MSSVDPVDRTVWELLELLDRERVAIRTMRGETVAALADEKQRLVEQLLTVTTSGNPAHVDGVRRASAALRRNGILLASARDILRDALGAAVVPSPIVPGRASIHERPTSRPALVSVRG